MPTTLADRWWQRSSFGSILWIVGVAAIHWIWTGEVPSEDGALNVLGLVIILLGYQKFRPTSGLPRADLP